MGAGRCGDGERGWHTTEPDEESRSSFASYTPLSPLSTFRSLAFGSFHFTSWEDWEAWANVRSERPKGTSDKGSGTDKERREREVKGVRKRVRDGTADNMTRHDPRPGTTLVTSAVRRVVTPLRALHSLPIPSATRSAPFARSCLRRDESGECSVTTRKASERKWHAWAKGRRKWVKGGHFLGPVPPWGEGPWGSDGGKNDRRNGPAARSASSPYPYLVGSVPAVGRRAEWGGHKA